jgi:hypothetical protein
MAKRRKRTNKAVPAKGRLQDIADRLWSLAVKNDWANLCAVCGRRDGKIDPHHVVPRQHFKHRYDLRNGIALCVHCHNFDPDVAPHKNAAAWLQWLEHYHPELHRWYVETTATQAYKQFNGTINAAYYCGVIRGLRQYVDEDDYTRIVGQRFSRWLEENGGNDGV